MKKRKAGIRDEASRSPSLVTGYNGTAPLYTTAGNKPMTVYDAVSLPFCDAHSGVEGARRTNPAGCSSFDDNNNDGNHNDMTRIIIMTMVTTTIMMIMIMMMPIITGNNF